MELFKYQEILMYLHIKSIYGKRESQRMIKKPRRPIFLSPTTKNIIKNRMYQKVGSSKRKCTESLNQSNRYKCKNKKISPRTVQTFLKSTDCGKTKFKLPNKPLLNKKH